MKRLGKTERFTKLWYFEASTYNYTINLSMGFANAFAIKVLGYGLPELGLLTVFRTLAVFISQPFAAMLSIMLRSKRKSLWFIAGALNRLLWSLVPLALFLPGSKGLAYLIALTFVAQFSGGIAGVAAMDCVGSNVPSSRATAVFSRVNKLSYLAVALSQLAGIAVFTVVGEQLVGYAVIYAMALVSAVLSTVLLYAIPDNRENLTREPLVRFSSALKAVEDSRLSRYLFVIALFNFSVNIPAPFWDYLVLSVTSGRELFIPLKNIANLLTKYVAIDLWQKQAIKKGLRNTLIEGMAFTTLVPVLYLEASSATHIVFAEVVSGVVWAPVDVGTTVYSTYLPSDNTRPVYISTVNLLVNGVASAAATVGTVLATWTGSVYTCLVASAVMRVLTAGIAYKVLPDINSNHTFERSKRI